MNGKINREILYEPILGRAKKKRANWEDGIAAWSPRKHGSRGGGGGARRGPAWLPLPESGDSST